MKTPDTLNRLALSMAEGLGPIQARALLSVCDNDLSIVFSNETPDALAGLSPTIRERLHDKTIFERAKRELEFMENHGIEMLWFEDDDYPARLKECPDAPLVLYKKGDADMDVPKVLSIVGTRKMTAYGRSQTEELVRALAEKVPDVLVVSGLALGADVCAHRAALSNNITTVGVLGNGLSQIYPPANRDTARQMAESGALLTELPHDTPIERFRFLQRNRIIAGLSDACIVVESAVRGGSMSTARLARDYNREVLAIPGRNIDPYSQGCNYLIEKNIASILTCPDDVLKLLNWDFQEKAEQGTLFPSFNPDELTEPLRSVVNLFEPGGEYTVEQLFSLQKGDTATLSICDIVSALLQLELQSIVTHLSGNRYRLT